MRAGADTKLGTPMSRAPISPTERIASLDVLRAVSLFVALFANLVTAFRQSMLLSKGNLSIFWSNPLVGSIVALALVLLAWPLISRIIGALRAKPQAAAPA